MKGGEEGGERAAKDRDRQTIGGTGGVRPSGPGFLDYRSWLRSKVRRWGRVCGGGLGHDSLSRNTEPRQQI